MKNLDEEIDQLCTFLSDLNAGDRNHLFGPLIEHLKGTYWLLNSWGNNTTLCLAGLYHAVYSTSGFDSKLISENQRDVIKEMLGAQTEKIVYTYCACDRDFFWPQIGVNANPIFLDRFTGSKYQLSLNELRAFCELTIANELQIAKDNDPFIRRYGTSLNDLFFRMRPYVSARATRDAIQIIGDNLIHFKA